ncbi:bifunctional phosphoribosylaminoimidazolecarboxamide formyltransferase/IMP cyclohydrolase [candidate division WOR-1 bacterium RIFOXYA12_FULL_52_29]|uniref:Bifunctional purine biosynthesis protein PurH n=1 Tax=candidate division WOR-1 bacterium RIFOXYC12_FULL_54_18 TaxID=1802584 RepID=A0A1F4T4C0_UNCSA|nr:MAG: bifunctional phosphoribosylaminoimidazolecarboxamide formyltransferase/IMP cyclohydrolase [candidate division WOR-1 bacterium RIFOXYA2_FULL_51_19]OGC17023.1 MAG: bifunctional phosphoribosylaminoimidazolecarboxamide formyltransferase/IMP cyclohydrolase [candidate division WOR-1 bacterium RIFOXYA12_FULL_52_29]OGC25884.1 MAG: bifunctional phosphoribosylaminoimidazolecarboxamide formyltransferase/IMP cyclohydrolase [candidate division WOR-1 bacterium RIFOXYB2_FULL_45_9]OGC27440.1 MAG: bifunc
MKKKKRGTRNGIREKRYALISVWEKTGLDKFAKELIDLGFELISSGGTAEYLKNVGIKATEVSKLTKYPHMLGGRVKTLHPIIHGGILADRTNPEHLKELKKFKIDPFDLVVCNLYPFEKVISRKKFTHDEAIENIDIGGPSMVRGAAKNHKNVGIVVDPADYGKIIEELKNTGVLSLSTKENLALKAYKHTAQYDALIAQYLSGRAKGEEKFPKGLSIQLEKIQDLRYGENPHQQAALYRERGGRDEGRVTDGKQLHGKELSFNNIVDMESAWSAANYFVEPTICIVKHSNPCGLAKAKLLVDAYKLALASDPVSAFGGIISANRRIDEATAKEVAKLFVEVIIAPAYTPQALAILKVKANLRIIEMGTGSVNKPFQGLDYKRVSGGLLVQDADLAQLAVNEVKVVTKRQPTVAELDDLFFAWGAAKYVKSNAIVLVKDGATVGVGAGQMSRIDSTEIAVKKAGDKAKGSVLASDAFFPFSDVVEAAAKNGITAIIQPGGAKRDQESIDMADKHKIAMVFTGRRHFRH